MNKESIDWWLSHMKSGEDFSQQIYTQLTLEHPQALSWVATRECNLQCQHCIFQKESDLGSQDDKGIINLAKQYPIGSPFIHEGRILKPEHLNTMKEVQRIGLKVGLIDNGTYLRHKNLFDFRLDWIDISIDGTREVHNLQRSSPNAYQQALGGLRGAREVARKVTSLFTITSINYTDIESGFEEIKDLIDEFHIIPLSPARPEIGHLETSQEQMRIAWSQIRELQQKYPNKIFFRSYRYEDIAKIFLSSDSLKSSLDSALVGTGKVILNYQDVPITWIPKSTTSTETLVVDTDGYIRIPYAVAFTLSELKRKIDRRGNDIAHYTVCKLNKELSLSEAYQKALTLWWGHYGLDSLKEEKKIFFNQKQ